MIGQVGLNVDFSAGWLYLFLVLPTVWLFGSLFGGLAIISATEGKSRRGPLILASLAICSSVTLFILTRGIDRGFDVGTFLGIVPALLGSWALFDHLTRKGETVSTQRRQFSMRSILNVMLCASVAVGGMAYFHQQSERAWREQKAYELISYAKMILATPTLCADTGDFGIDLIVNNPDEAIALCTEAIELAPDNAEAYNLRASAYELTGDAPKARQDRLRAKTLGYRPAASSDTEQRIAVEPE